jgi:hypothetical protein
MGLIVALALAGSAWLAYASTTPSGGTYPVQAVKATGHGQVNPCVTDTSKKKPKTTCSKFNFNVVRDQKGKVSGHLQVTCEGTTEVKYNSTAITSFVVTGNTANIGTTGKLNGKQFKGQTFTADATAVDNSPDTFTATIRNSSNQVVCSVAGPLTHKGDKIEIKQLGK